MVGFHPSDKSPIWSPFSFNTPSAPGYNSGDVGRRREVKSAGERETAYKAGNLAITKVTLLSYRTVRYVASSTSAAVAAAAVTDGHARALLLLLLLVLLIN